MNHRLWKLLGICLIGGHGLVAATANAADSAAVKTLFSNPPGEFTSAPFIVWNDMLTDEQVQSTLRDMAEQNIRQAIIHPRPGLMTPYLSDEWFRLWKVALDEAERLDMDLWIYDENSYPSGFAGGFVPEAMPESRGRGLVFREVKRVDRPAEDVIGVYRLTGDKSEDVTGQARAGATLPEGKYLIATIQRAKESPWYGGKFYVDLLYPGVTQKFLELTLEPYRRRFGEQFGKRIPGSFTDEPQLRPAGGLPWTDDLPQQFEKRWGYRLTDHLPSLARPVGDWRRVRHNYFQLVLELFIARWAKPYYDYCAKNHFEFTGHYWDHEWPGCISVTDNMAMYAWQQRPGIDCLMNQYREETNAQFGNVRMVKELSSVANQVGQKRTLCEIYGAGGWDLRFEDMKRIGDWLVVLGVNTLNEHLSYVTLRGARKHDHPQSFSYHEPWWDSYHVIVDHFTRLSAATTQGRQICPVLVIEPTTTAWLYQQDAGQREQLKQLGVQFQDLVNALERAQVEYDLGCENVIADHGAVDGKRFKVGRQSYHTVVLPPMTDNLNTKTIALLEEFVKAGGRVIACGAAPSLVEGQASDRGQKLAQQACWKQLEPSAVPAALLAVNTDGFAIRRSTDDKGVLLHQRRQLDDGQLVLLVNTSIESPSTGLIETKARGIEQWDTQTGKAAPYRFTAGQDGSKAEYQIPPCGSLLLFLSDKPTESAPAATTQVTAVRPVGSMQVRRAEPNVLTIDYFDVTAGGETLTSANFYKASTFAFQKHGLPYNPWDHAVQFRDELISKRFSPESGVEATYRFTIDEKVPQPLSIVIERPDLYTVTCNGKPVQAAAGAWWLDRAFGKIDITAIAQVGENAVTIKASPFTVYHELQPAYVLGDFSLRAADKGFVIAPAKPLSLGPWNQQGCPLYAAGVGYTQRFDVGQPSGRYRVTVPAWYGSVAKVLVNGQLAGHLVSQPWECDVTDALKPGENTVEVVVIGTLKNPLGPHHGNPPLGTAWPASFRKGPEVGPPPGAEYHTLGYGLLEPFRLEQTAK